MDTLFYLIEKFPREFPHDQIPSPIRAAIQKTEQIYGEAFMREAIDKCYDRGVMTIEYLRAVVGAMVEEKKKQEKQKEDLKKRMNKVQDQSNKGGLYVVTWKDKDRKPRIVSEDEATSIGIEMKNSSHVTIIGMDGLQAEIANKYDIKQIQKQKQVEGQQLANCHFYCEYGTHHNALTACKCYYTYKVEWWKIWDVLRDQGHIITYGHQVTKPMLESALLLLNI